MSIKQILKVSLIPLFAAFLMVTTTGPTVVEAQLDPTFVDDACEGFTGEPTTGGCGDSSGVEGVLKSVLNILSYAVGAISLIIIVIGGLRYVLANGDPQAIQTAKNTIIYAVVGLVIALIAQSIVQFVLNEV